MSDSRGGRGRGGGRGGPQRGNRGGRGDRGGAEGRGGRGGTEGRGGQHGSGPPSETFRGAGYQGGRGRGGRGDFQGDSRGRGGGGGYRGGYQGRGGSGGYRGGYQGGGGFGSYQDVYGQDTTIPQPDQQVTTLEDDFITGQGTSLSQLTSRLGKLSVAASSGESSTDVFPCRPAFGTAGTEVVLWANYFALEAKALSLSKYALELTYVPAKTEHTTSKSANAGKSSKGPAQEKKAAGRKLKQIIQLALEQLPRSSTVATEYKAQVLSLKKLKLPDDGIIPVRYTEPGRDRVETWNVKFNGPTAIHVDHLLAYLKSMMDPAGDTNFPKFAAEVDALGVVLGHTARAKSNTVAVGRGRFFATDRPGVEGSFLGDRSPLSVLRGYFQSVRPATGRLLLNVNVTHGVFRRPGALSDLLETLRLNNMDDVPGMPQHVRSRYLNELKRLHKVLKRARIEVKVPSTAGGSFERREVVVMGLASSKDVSTANHEKKPQFSLMRDLRFEFGGPTTTRFYLDEPAESGQGGMRGLTYNQHCTVEQYYKSRYNFKANPRLPLINIGRPGKPIYVLAELCTLIPGQPVKNKLSPDEQAAMIKFACRIAPQNARSIATSARELLGLDNNSLLSSFGISVAKQLLTVKGRELKAPTLIYDKKSIDPQNGSWLMKNINIAKPGNRIKDWTYIYSKGVSNPKEIKETVSEFVSFIADKLGVNISLDPSPANGVAARFDQEQDLRRAFNSLAKQPRQFILVVLPTKDPTSYNTVKKLADVEYGVHTVCVVDANFSKRKLDYYTNVGLKVNLKFGGDNHQLKEEIELIKSGKTMVVGYDVTHPTNLPSGTAEGLPSIVGLVASVDNHLGQWPAVSWNNRQGKEMLGDELNANFQSRLQLWLKHNGSLPENIVIFRDGVSEGQFRAVLEEELPHIRSACETMYRSKSMKQPQISLIVSVKRHQTRFYPTDPTPGHLHPRSKSPNQGTVVDRGVTNVRYWDFFLQAHAALQGTARPAHYTVLLDEVFRTKYGADKAADKLEKFTHDMCYLFGRATKAVSICPPAYYADLVCTRARAHKSELFDDATDTDAGSSSGTGADSVRSRSVHHKLQDSMYYI